MIKEERSGGNLAVKLVCDSNGFNWELMLENGEISSVQYVSKGNWDTEAGAIFNALEMFVTHLYENGVDIFSRNGMKSLKQVIAEIPDFVKSQADWNAEYTSVWENGAVLNTRCVWDVDNQEIIDTETVDLSNCGGLEREYVTYNGEEFNVCDEEE